jgi:hypothetical protein
MRDLGNDIKCLLMHDDKLPGHRSDANLRPSDLSMTVSRSRQVADVVMISHSCWLNHASVELLSWADLCGDLASSSSSWNRIV